MQSFTRPSPRRHVPTKSATPRRATGHIKSAPTQRPALRINDAYEGCGPTAGAPLMSDGSRSSATAPFAKAKKTHLPKAWSEAALPVSPSLPGLEGTRMRGSLVRIGQDEYVTSSMIACGASGKIRLALSLNRPQMGPLVLKELRRVPVRVNHYAPKNAHARFGYTRTEYEPDRNAYAFELAQEVYAARHFGMQGAPVALGRSHKNDYLVLPYMHSDIFGLSQACAPGHNSLLAQAFALQISAQLAHMHAQNWVHADFKVANALINFDTGLIQAADFGRAMQLGRDGTFVYVECTSSLPAPETFAANPIVADAKIDVWALGASVAEILVGTRKASPFYGESSFAQQDFIAWRAQYLQDGIFNGASLHKDGSGEFGAFARKMYAQDGPMTDFLFSYLLVADPAERVSMHEAQNLLQHTLLPSEAHAQALRSDWQQFCEQHSRGSDQHFSGQIFAGLEAIGGWVQDARTN